MKVTWDNSSPVEVTLTVEMATEDENPYLERSYRRAVGRVNIPGFRRGRAPRHVVENMVGRVALIQEALDFMVPETLSKALADEAVAAFAEPSIEVTQIDPVVSFTATIPLEPGVDLGDYRSVRVPQDPVTISDEQIDGALQRMQEQQVVWEPVERPVQYGDRLNINVQGTMGEDTIVNEQDVEYIPTEDSVLPFPGFASYLLGAAEDDELAFTLRVPDDYPRPTFAGRDVDFQVSVLAVKEKNVPELDDEFARSLSEGYDDFASLRASVVANLTAQAEAAARNELEQKSLAAICQVAIVNASPLLYEREVDAIRSERERMLQQQGLDMATYLNFMGKSEDEYLAEMRPDAERSLTTRLILRKLAEVEQIEISDDDVQAESERLLESSTAEDATDENIRAMREFLNSTSTRDNIRSSLHARRVLERLTEITQGKLDDEYADADGDDQWDVQEDNGAGIVAETSDTAADLNAAASASISDDVDANASAQPDTDHEGGDTPAPAASEPAPQA